MEIAAVVVALVLLLAGSVWVFLPFVSGPMLSWGGLLACHLMWPQGPVGVPTLIFCGVVAVASKVFDWLASAWSARRFGASAAGAIGALVGGVVAVIAGLLTGYGLVLGALLGPALGAMAGELLAGREAHAAMRAGLGASLGFFAAMVVSLAACGLMAAVFVTELLIHGLSSL